MENGHKTVHMMMIMSKTNIIIIINKIINNQCVFSESLPTWHNKNNFIVINNYVNSTPYKKRKFTDILDVSPLSE